MTRVLLTRGAASALYSSTGTVIVTESCYKAVSGQLNETTANLLVLSTGGQLCLPGQKPVSEGEAVPAPGAPGRLLAIVCGAGQDEMVQSVQAFFAEQGIAHTPEIIHLPKGPVFLKRRRWRKLMATVLARLLGETQRELAEAHKQIVAQRVNTEGLRQQQEKTRRMLAAIGYGTQYVTVDLTPGNQTLGPGGAVNQHTYSQILPVACAGLRGVSLFVAALPDNREKGSLAVRVRRSADHQAVLTETVPLARLRVGWNGFLVTGDGLASIDDAVLELTWLDADGLLIAFSDTEADRFGDEEGRTLALRVYQGLIEPDQFDTAPSDAVAVNVPSMITSRQLSASRLPDVSENFSYYRGSEAHEQLGRKYSFPIMMMNGETRVMQLHPVTEGLSATLYQRGVPADALRVSTEVATANANAPSFTYVLIVLPSATVDKAALIDTVCAQIQEMGDYGYGQLSGALWIATSIPAMTRTLLELDLPTGRTEPMDAAFAVLPQGGKISFGWCRWYSFGLTRPAPDWPAQGAGKAN